MSALFNESEVRRGYQVTERYERLYGRWHIDSQLMHIVTEIAEVRDVIRNKDNKYGPINSQQYRDKLGDEIADVFLTSLATAGHLGITAEELNGYITKKLGIVEKRLAEKEQQIQRDVKSLLGNVIGKEQ